MKQHRKTTSRSLTTIARFLFVALLLTGGSAFAQVQGTNPKASISYNGIVGNKVFFSVEVNNENNTPFTIEVLDGDGYRFYNDRFNQKNFRKIFAFETEGIEKNSIVIRVVTKEGVQKQVFAINAISKTVDEVSVVKL